LKLFWRTKSAADEYVDITEHTRKVAIREASYQATAEADSRVLRISGKPIRVSQRISGLVERVRLQQ
jgi:hypothetical protein